MIKECMRVYNGKLKYCIIMDQENKKICIFIDSSNNIRFEDNRYCELLDFNFKKESHKVAKEIFLTCLQAEVKTRLLELRQLELILDQLGLTGIIRNTLVENSTMLISQKEEIIKESINRSEKLIDEKIEKNIRPIAKRKAKER